MSKRKYTAGEVAQMLMDSDSDDSDGAEDVESEGEVDMVEINEYVPDEMEIDEDERDVGLQEELDVEEVKIAGRNGYEWSKKAPPPASFRQNNIVRIPLGIKPLLAELDTVEDFFRGIVTSYIIERIRVYTNKRLSMTEDEITYEEMEAFVGLLILFGVTKKHDVDVSLMWNKESVHFCPQAQMAMSRERFQIIAKRITFDDIEKRHENDGSDKFFKSREVFEYIRDKIRNGIEPAAQLCVDETLYKFRGRCRFRQYMPNKPAKYGIKYYAIACAETGYILDIEVYLGKPDNGARNQRVGETIVMKLSEQFYRTGRGVTMDNFFTSEELAEILWANGLTLVGTMRKNKKVIPQSFLPNKSREPYSTNFAFAGPLTLTSYVPKPNKAVVLLSTQHHSATVSNNEAKKPDIILTYNATKGTVDAFDQKIEKFTCRRRTLRWTVNVFYYLIDLAVTNSIILSQVKHKIKPSKRYRRVKMEELAISLIKPAIAARVEKWKRTNFVGIPSQLKSSVTSKGFLTPAEIPTNDTTTQRCFLCPKRRRTSNCCHLCEKNVCKDHSEFICTQCKQ